MEIREREEAIYENYLRETRELEEAREDCERKKRKFEHYKERRQNRWREERGWLEGLLERWGSCRETGEMMSLLEQTIAGEKGEQEEREQELKTELKGIHKKLSECEERYQSERNREGDEQ